MKTAFGRDVWEMRVREVRAPDSFELNLSLNYSNRCCVSDIMSPRIVASHYNKCTFLSLLL